jgi:hypothetical protein
VDWASVRECHPSATLSQPEAVASGAVGALGVSHTRAAASAVLHVAFTVLGATRAISDAWIGNCASLRVSRKLGYVDAGTELHHPRGEPVVHQVLHLDATHFTSPVPIVVEGAQPLAQWVASTREGRGSSDCGCGAPSIAPRLLSPIPLGGAG